MILVWCGTAWEWILDFLDNKNNMVTCSGGWPFLVSLVTFIPACFFFQPQQSVVHLQGSENAFEFSDVSSICSSP